MTRGGNQRMFKQLLLCLRVLFLRGGQRHRGEMPLGEAEPHSEALSTNTLRQWWKSSLSSTAHAIHWASDGPYGAEQKPRGAGRVKPHDAVFLRATRLNVNSFITFGPKCPIWIFSHPCPTPSNPFFPSVPSIPSLYLFLWISFSSLWFCYGQDFFSKQKYLGPK